METWTKDTATKKQNVESSSFFYEEESLKQKKMSNFVVGREVYVELWYFSTCFLFPPILIFYGLREIAGI